MKMKTQEKIIVAIVFSLFSLLLSFTNIYYSISMGDAAIFSELLESINKTAKPMSQIHANLDDYLFSLRVITLEPELFEQHVFNAPVKPAVNFFNFHFYPILYLFAWMAYFFPSHIALGIVETVAFTLPLLLAYSFLRKRNIPRVISIFFVLFLLVHPGWSDSLRGQIYPDRIFIFTAFILCLSLSMKKKSIPAMLFSALGCVLVGERGMAIGGAILFGHCILFWKKPSKKRIFEGTIGLIMILMYFITIKLLDNRYYGGNTVALSINDFMTRLKYPLYIEKTRILIFINIVLYGTLAVFNWRWFLIAAGAIVPNIITYVGGAEKTNFFTHYHSYYIPIIFIAAMMGLLSLYKFSRRKNSFFSKNRLLLNNILLVLLALLIFITGSYNYNNFTKFELRPKQLSQNILVKGLQEFISGKIPNTIIFEKNSTTTIQKIIPKGSLVSTVESGILPMMYHGNQIQIFPAGIDNADYAIVTIKDITQEYLPKRFAGTVTFLGPEKKSAIDQLVFEHMQEIGYDIEHAELIAGKGIAVIKREKSNF